MYKIEPETDPNIPITRSTVKRRRLSSETPSGKLLNDSIASNNTDSTSNISHQSASNKSEDDLELKEEVNDDEKQQDIGDGIYKHAQQKVGANRSLVLVARSPVVT